MAVRVVVRDLIAWRFPQLAQGVLRQIVLLLVRQIVLLLMMLWLL